MKLGELLILSQQQSIIEKPKPLQAGPKLTLQLIRFNFNRGPAAINLPCDWCPGQMSQQQRQKTQKIRTKFIVCQMFCWIEHSAISCDRGSAT